MQLSFWSFPGEDGLLILSFRTSAEGINRCLETLGRTRGGLFGRMGGLGLPTFAFSFFFFFFTFGFIWGAAGVGIVLLD